MSGITRAARFSAVTLALLTICFLTACAADVDANGVARVGPAPSGVFRIYFLSPPKARQCIRASLLATLSV